MPTSNSIGNRIINTVAGENSRLLVENTSNTAGADAIERIQTPAGLAQVSYIVNGVTTWTTGLNNSNQYVVSTGGTECIVVHPDYNMTRPNTDAFTAALAGNTAACTGDGTVYVLGTDIGGTPYPYGTPAINTQSSFDETTGIFTASRGGLYLFTATIRMGSVGTAMTTGFLDFFVNNTTAYRFAVLNGAVRGFGSDLLMSGSVIVSLSTSNTVRLRCQLGNSTLTAIVIASGTRFSGVLLS